MGIYTYDTGQHIFDRALWGLWIAAKWILKAIVYLPLWFTSYIIVSNILHKEDSAFAWMGLIVIFAVCLYQLLFFVKGMIIGLKHYHNLFWILLFILCLIFTCILPVWFVFDTIHFYAVEWSTKSADILTWFFAMTFGLFIYGRYHFLTNIAPLAAYPAYQMGIDTVLKILNITSKVSAIKSKQLF
jgi:hypothetical protein